MKSVEQWDIFEAAFEGPADQTRPFMDVEFSAFFRHLNRDVVAEGFWDGDRTWRVRVMPDAEGEWSFRTRSNRPELDGRAGTFTCTPPGEGNHGPVRVADRFHFAHADGTRFSNVGTTCYAWVHQGDAMAEQTLATLTAGPFNKIRMCVMPKSYRYNENEPEEYPFVVTRRGSSSWAGQSDSSQPVDWEFDFDRVNPAFFRNVEHRVGQLRDLGIEADVILFHPYDRWGFAKMPPEVDDRYLRYVIARLAAYRNVWWSFANEWDIMREKTEADWERYARIVRECDPSDHLRSIHNCRRNYDHSRGWVTHVSFQGHPNAVAGLRERHDKPVVVDECCYEGDLPNNWGNISGAELTRRFWQATCRGGYCGHGETYAHPEDILWWSRGGVLHGQSPARIAFLRQVVEERAELGGLEPWPDAPGQWRNNAVARGDGPAEWMIFTDDHQPRCLEIDLPAGQTYDVQVIDPWEMTVTDAEGGPFAGRSAVPLPVRPGLVVRGVARE